MEWMFLPLRRYVQFSGRSGRKEFWRWVLFLILASIVLSIIDQALGLNRIALTSPRPVTLSATPYSTSGRGLLTNIFSLATFLPNLAVQVRRLHDTDRSGWWLLLPLLPIIVGIVAIAIGVFGSRGVEVAGILLIVVGGLCSILLLVWFCTDGIRGANRFGDDPKGPQDLSEVFR